MMHSYLIKMPREGWKSISIPEEMKAEIERVIKERPELGYKSIAGFIADAIRKNLKELNVPLENQDNS